jgi:hypothetical protein
MSSPHRRPALPLAPLAAAAICGGLRVGEAGAARVDPAPVRALLVGISAYPDFDPTRPAIGAARDLDALSLALQARGVEPAAILRVEDQAATRAGVVAAIRGHLAAAPQGAHLLLHLSGHGARRPDNDGDESDGQDELLLTYGAGPPLDDDTLAALIAELRTAVGPAGSVVVSVDACFGAGALRGEGAARVRGAGPPGAGADLEAGPGAAPVVLLGAARADEVAREVPAGGQRGAPAIGAFSGALAEALSRPTHTWEEVHQHVRLLLSTRARGQHPEATGALGLGVFGPAAARPAPGLRIDGADSAGRLRLAAGTLLGLGPGAELEVEAPGGARARLRVEAAELGQAWLEAPLDGGAAYVGGLARPVRLPPAAAAVRLAGGDDPLRAAWSAQLAAAPGLVLTDDARLVVDLDDGVARLQGPSGPLAVDPPGAGPVGEVWAALLREAAAAQAMDPGAPVHPGLRLAVLEAEGASACTRPVDAVTAEQDVTTVPLGARLRVAVHLGAGESQHLTLLHADSEGQVQVLWPPPGGISEPLRAGAWWSPPVCWPVTPPLGTERIRAVVTPQALDLRPFLDGGGRSGLEPVAGGVADRVIEIVAPAGRAERR